MNINIEMLLAETAKIVYIVSTGERGEGMTIKSVHSTQKAAISAAHKLFAVPESLMQLEMQAVTPAGCAEVAGIVARWVCPMGVDTVTVVGHNVL